VEWTHLAQDSDYAGKAVPQHTYGGAVGERSYSSYSFTTSALDRMSGQRHAPQCYVELVNYLRVNNV
jgi:hypothetical protein